jgi:hypothetical protein
LKLLYDELLSNFGFKLNLRHYYLDAAAAALRARIPLTAALLVEVKR